MSMLYNYLAAIFFAIVGMLIPVGFLLTAKLLEHRVPGNQVKNAPWESAEETIGSSRDIDNEYLPYFMLFLPFEIVLVVLILWSTVAKAIGYNTGIAILSLAVLATAFSLIGYKLIGAGSGRATNAIYKRAVR